MIAPDKGAALPDDYERGLSGCPLQVDACSVIASVILVGD